MSKFRLSSTLRRTHDIVNLNQQGKNLLSVLVIVTVFSFLSFTSLLLCIQLLTNFQNLHGKILNEIDWLGVNAGF